MRSTADSAIVDKYLPIIKNYYPDISSEKITVFHDGYDHDVLLINKHQAFRFPRTKDQGEKDHVENVFLSAFAKISPISVQKITSHTDPGTGSIYQMYRFIQGTQLTKKLALTLTDHELANIATNMGKFLTTLHSSPLVEARTMEMDELDPITYWKYFERLLEKIRSTTFHLLSKYEQRWIEKLVEDYIYITRDNPFEVKVTHSDLLAEHIIFGENTHALNGVIDFSLRIADPANDFKFFDRYGSLFLKIVYKNYLPIDKYFDQRRKFYAGHVPVINLYEAIERKDNKMTHIYLAQLKEYISQTNL